MAEFYKESVTRNYDPKLFIEKKLSGLLCKKAVLTFGPMCDTDVTFNDVIIFASVTDKYEVEVLLYDAKGAMFAKFYTPINKMRRNGLMHLNKIACTTVRFFDGDSEDLS